MEYDVVVGIEIHLELNTLTKMFSGAPYKFKQEANTCTNEVDLGMPGTLPCLNKGAVKKAIALCSALHMDIDTLVKFDRKNYYYSDLPKGFQITQQFHPIGSNGYIDIYLNNEYKRIRINRCHMEEDTAKQFHLNDFTLIDYNRSGVPLCEIVSEPDITSGIEAQLYVEKLRQTFEYLGISDAKMEEGEMRCDVNVSIMLKGSKVFGTKVEIKNLNSIANVKEAIDYEVKRQAEVLESGEAVVQETRRFDEKTMSTVSMRKKEGSVDYKYFPEPNIPPVRIPQSMIDREVNSLREEYKQRLAAQGINWDALVKAQGEDQLLKNLDEDAMTRIKNSLVIDKIAKVENIKLEQKDLEAKFAQLGAAYGLKPQDLLKQLGQNPEVLASISQQAMNDKVREFLMNNNKVEIK